MGEVTERFREGYREKEERYTGVWSEGKGEKRCEDGIRQVRE